MSGSAPGCAVVTVAYERRDHLRAQLEALDHQTRPADVIVVVDMGGPPIATRLPSSDLVLEVVSRPAADPYVLNLSRARNAGRAAADADVTVFLDVDCAPTVSLVADYLARVRQRPGVWSGPVGYLPPGVRPRPDQLSALPTARFQDGRPQPGQGDGRLADIAMFWSLSFAVDRNSWNAIGGFDEKFEGYGGEDTDFARAATAAGVELWCSGAAVAHHQHHPVSTPPVEHLDAICRNAALFFGKWGSWPMGGWLRTFADRGLIDWDPAGSVLRRTSRSSSGEHDVETDRSLDEFETGCSGVDAPMAEE